MNLQPAELRRRRQREDARRAILDATEALLLEEGYEGLSIRRLAARCGYTAPTIYHHFGDKTGLIDALLDQRFRQVVATLRAVPRNDDAAVYLRDMAGAFVRFGLENGTMYRLFSIPRDETKVLPSAEEGRALVEGALRELAEQGRLVTSDIDAAVQSLWAVLHGLIALRISRPDYAWSDNQVEVALDAVTNGLGSERGP